MYLRLNDDETTIDEVFGTFFANECTIERVRAAEPGGFDAAAWQRLAQTGAPGMSVAEASGGAGADLATAAIVAGHVGASLAPVPFVEHAAATRLLASIAPDHPVLGDLVSGTKIATVATRPARDGVAPLVPAGAVADVVISMRGHDLVMHIGEAPGSGPKNTACLPLANRSLETATVLVSGTQALAHHRTAVAEWQVLMAAALAGLGRRAVDIGVAYTKERYQFGVLIGTFQGIQHGLATAVTNVEGARFLASRATWHLDAATDEGQRLAAMAFIFAAEAAIAAAASSLQYHGGYGFAEEYDIQLYYRRAKGWALQYGDPNIEIQRIAALTLPSAKPTPATSPIGA